MLPSFVLLATSVISNHLPVMIIWSRQWYGQDRLLLHNSGLLALRFHRFLSYSEKKKKKKKRAYLDASSGSDITTGITLDPLSWIHVQLYIFQTCSSLTKTPHSPCFSFAFPFLGFLCGFSSFPNPHLFFGVGVVSQDTVLRQLLLSMHT